MQIDHVRRAIELNPSEATNHLWYAIYHAVFGEDAGKAVAEAHAAARLDPWSPITALMVSSVYLLLDDFAQAREQAQTIVGMFPGSLHGHRVLATAYLGEGLFEHAIVALEKGMAIARESASVALLAQAYGWSGQLGRARALVEELVQRGVASRLGLSNGTRVRLRNQDGVVSNPVRVKATERIRPDCVYLVHGFGHTSRMLRRALGKGASDAQLATRYLTDPLMGGTGMNVNFVTLEAEA